MTELYPVVKLNDPSLRDIWKGLDLPYLVVRLQDLITSSSGKPNKTFYEVKFKGGIHNYLDYGGKVILSLVMKDKLILKFSPKLYAEIINEVKPNYFTSVDGETYDREEKTSFQEILRCVNETKQLINLCPNVTCIGHVKGCNESQIHTHLNQLNSLGIKHYLFHVGDFFRSGSKEMINKAKHYASIIRKKAYKLILYGMGSQKKLIEFSFADAYVSFNYFVKAINGKKYSNHSLVKYTGGYSTKIVRSNLVWMILNLKRISNQRKLTYGGIDLWEAEQEALELHTHQQEEHHIQQT